VTDDTLPVPLTTRHATLDDLTRILREQHARKIDVVTRATALRAQGGNLLIEGTEPELGADGVTLTCGTYRPTGACEQGIGDKLGIPVAYLRRMREEHPGLWDVNVGEWLRRDERTFLVRCLRGDTGTGVARAFLSDGYKRIEHLDVLMAALDGVRESGYPVEVTGCDLSERRMYLHVSCDQVRVMAPLLLAGYRSPFTGASGADNPVIEAGFVITNSETGDGAATVIPRLTAQVCSNGMTITRDAVRAIHQGERLDEGLITWSADTSDKVLAVLTAKTRDAVRTFLDPAYVQRAVRAMEKDAGHPVTDPAEAIKVISSQLRFTDAQAATILSHFIRGGDLTAGGVMHAVTSAAQVMPDADTAHEMEAASTRALTFAAAL
jgi:hypothetical protein